MRTTLALSFACFLFAMACHGQTQPAQPTESEPTEADIRGMEPRPPHASESTETEPRAPHALGTAGTTETDREPTEVGAQAEPNAAHRATRRTTTPPLVEPWAQVLAQFVTDDGGFRYAALATDAEARERLQAYVRAVGEASGEGWTRDEALAFYINAYNALTVNAVIERWPIESVMDVEGFFDAHTHRVAGRAITLNQLENDILRSEVYAEPRIHFAINCASASCPPLQPEPFTARNLGARLATATRVFVRATTRREGRAVWLSKIFEWFAADFDRVGGTRAFVASQLAEADAEAVRDPRTHIRFDEYDWALNARP